jgi:hypothetical protein
MGLRWPLGLSTSTWRTIDLDVRHDEVLGEQCARVS